MPKTVFHIAQGRITNIQGSRCFNDTGWDGLGTFLLLFSLVAVQNYLYHKHGIEGMQQTGNMVCYVKWKYVSFNISMETSYALHVPYHFHKHTTVSLSAKANSQFMFSHRKKFQKQCSAWF